MYTTTCSLLPCKHFLIGLCTGGLMDRRYFPLNIDLLFHTHILPLWAKANLKNARDAFTLIFCAFRYICYKPTMLLLSCRRVGFLRAKVL